MQRVICFFLRHDWHIEKSHDKEQGGQVSFYRICLRCGQVTTGVEASEESASHTLIDKPKGKRGVSDLEEF